MIELDAKWHRYKGCFFGMSTSTLVGRARISVDKPTVPIAVKAEIAQLMGLPESTDAAPAGSLANQIMRNLVWLTNAVQSQQGVIVPQAHTLISERSAGGETRFEFAIPFLSDICAIQVINALAMLHSELPNEIAGADAKSAIVTTMQSLERICKPYRAPGTNNPLLLQLAHEKRLPIRFSDQRTLRVGTGVNGARFKSSITERTLSLGLDNARNKLDTATLLRAAGLPGAENCRINDQKALLEMAGEWGYPLVVKPINLDGGRGVSANIQDEETLLRSFKSASQLRAPVLLERHVPGDSYRISVIDGEVATITRKRPFGIIGNGNDSITVLLDELNRTKRSPQAASGHQLTSSTLDQMVLEQLAKEGLTPDSVLTEGEFLALRSISNTAQGGRSERLSVDCVHPDNLGLCAVVAELIGLDVAGIDIITEDISVSWRDSSLTVCEVNGMPQLGLAAARELLEKRLTGAGIIPMGLLVYDDGLIPSLEDTLHALAHEHGYTDTASHLGVRFNGRHWCGRFQNDVMAAEFACFSSQSRALLIALGEQELLQCGLPVPLLDHVFISRNVHSQTTELIEDHCRAFGSDLKITRSIGNVASALE